jgi:hypothetical protein
MAHARSEQILEDLIGLDEAVRQTSLTHRTD